MVWQGKRLFIENCGIDSSGRAWFCNAKFSAQPYMHGYNMWSKFYVKILRLVFRRLDNFAVGYPQWFRFSTISSPNFFSFRGPILKRARSGSWKFELVKPPEGKFYFLAMWVVIFLLPCVIVDVLDCGLSLLTFAIIARSFLLLVRGLRWKWCL
jgi:hypothetical protein